MKLSCWTNFLGNHKDKIESKNKSKCIINISQDFQVYLIWIIWYSTYGDFIFILSDVFVIYGKKYDVLVLMVNINVALFVQLFKEHMEQNSIIVIKNIRITTTLSALMSKVNCHEHPILYTIFVLNHQFSA